MRLFSSLILLSTVAACIGVQPSRLLASDSAPQEALSYKTFSNPFIQAAKKASTSVVSIKSHMNSSVSAHEEQTSPFPDEFWERFFGISPFQNIPKTERPPEQAFGSGFIVSHDGYILTNNHMVENSTKILVQFPDGHEKEAKKIGADAATDIALIKVDEKNLPFLTLADSANVEIGEWVMAIGNPLGLRASVSTGVISAKGRSDLDITLVEEFFQTDATINRGNSGGPLVNLNGDVIGMNTAIVTTTGGNMGIGFAISSNLLKDVMKELISFGKLNRGFLGIALQPIDQDLASALGLEKPQGALISEVMKNSPAEAAGLKSGDVITQVNGIAIETAGGLKKSIALMHADQKVDLTILRSGKVIKLTATVGSFPDEETRLLNVQTDFGMKLESITSDIAKRHNLSSTVGLLVTQIDPHGTAYAAGIRPGHVILTVNGEEVSSVDDFTKICASVEKGKKVLLQIRAGKQLRFVSVPVE